MSTSFDPASLACHNCAGGPHQILTAAGQSFSSPTCFILSDQNFPPPYFLATELTTVSPSSGSRMPHCVTWSQLS